VPVSASYGTQDSGDAKQNHHNKPLESATVLAWIPVCQAFDSVMRETSQDPERSREQRDCGLQTDANLGK